MTENLDTLWREYRADCIRPGDIVIDIGSSEGEFTRWCEQRGAHVYSYDARHNVAIGPYTGRCVVKGEGLGAYTVLRHDGRTHMMSLGTVLSQFDHVDFLKCDIEGGEYSGMFGVEHIPGHPEWEKPPPLSIVERFAIEFHAWTTPDKPVPGLGVRDEPMPENAFAKLVAELEATHQLDIVGPPEAGGYIYGIRK